MTKRSTQRYRNSCDCDVISTLSFHKPMNPQIQYEHSSSNLFLVRLIIQKDNEGDEEFYLKVQHILGRQALYLPTVGCQELIRAFLSLIDMEDDK